ncbi:MAG: orotidine-5'-phosphate decarboxylase [Phycisphaerae bacterium]|nr:orotidine-5'-phosphate decarboxylase [Phycisphaerae bacterium]
MVNHFADRLLAAIDRCDTPACVGFDPVLDRLPAAIRPDSTETEHAAHVLHQPEFRRRAAEAVTAFGRLVIEAVAGIVPAIKINVAFFEPFREHGISAYHELIREAHARDLIVIGDVKRADIGHTSQQYALAHLGDAPSGSPEDDLPDAITINPYFGLDGVGPFIEGAEQTGRGVFVLVQTSNPSAVEVQGLATSEGGLVGHRVGDLVERWASSAGRVGLRGYSLVGAVVSPRDLESTTALRERMPHCIFLVPGFGAQGRSLEEVAHCFRDDGTGAIVTASRSVIYAFPDDGREGDSGLQKAIRSAAEEFAGQLRSLKSAIRRL